ncbi:MAG: NUDIX hydrolase [Pseudonocardiaceae bacterium]|nr:NUDIX hydrolase [Pseudonocardiaceae bacterium]
MEGALLTALVVVLVLALIMGPWLVGTANRLMRLHVRTDAAWAAADAALARRAVVARAVAAAGCLPDEQSAAVRDAAERAEGTQREDREQAENELTELLDEVDRAALPPALAVELADAEHRVVIARRVHNDAVRDTLTQRRRRVVRWFKLAGTAPQPAYLEIAEPELHNGRDGPDEL